MWVCKMVFGKSGKLELNGKMLAVIAVIAILAIPSLRTPVFDFLGLGGGTTTPTPTEKYVCFIEETTITIGSAQERYNPTTNVEATEQIYHRVFKNDVDKGLLRDDTTLTGNPSDKLTIFWAENSTGTDNAGGYYSAKQEFVIPCKGEVTLGEQPDSEAYRLIAASNNITMTFENLDNNLINSETDNESLAAGDQGVFTGRIKGVYEDGWSPFGKIIAVIEANDTTYQDFNVQIDGVDVSVANVPRQYTVQSTDNGVWAFELPGCISACDIQFGLAVQVGTNGNPRSVGGTALAGGSNILVTYMDQDWYLDSDDGVEKFGVENDLFVDVGFQNPRTPIYIS